MPLFGMIPMVTLFAKSAKAVVRTLVIKVLFSYACMSLNSFCIAVYLFLLGINYFFYFFIFMYVCYVFLIKERDGACVLQEHLTASEHNEACTLESLIFRKTLKTHLFRNALGHLAH